MEEIIMNLVSIPAIVLIVYWIINLIKVVTNENENVKKLLPVIACFSGMILGAIIYIAVPNIIIADNIIYALIIGGASGMAATGTNQVFKQLSDSSVEDATISGDTEKVDTISGDTEKVDTISGDTEKVDTISGETEKVETISGDLIKDDTISGDEDKGLVPSDDTIYEKTITEETDKTDTINENNKEEVIMEDETVKKANISENQESKI